MYFEWFLPAFMSLCTVSCVSAERKAEEWGPLTALWKAFPVFWLAPALRFRAVRSCCLARGFLEGIFQTSFLWNEKLNLRWPRAFMCPHSGAFTPVVVTGHCNSFSCFLLGMHGCLFLFPKKNPKRCKEERNEMNGFSFYSNFTEFRAPPLRPPVAAGKRWPEQEEAENAGWISSATAVQIWLYLNEIIYLLAHLSVLFKAFWKCSLI